MRDLAEIAVESQDAGSFRQHALHRLMQVTGADAEAFTGTATKIRIDMWDADAAGRPAGSF